MRLALAQIDCRLGNLPANLAAHRAALAAVRDAGGAALALFPELSLTGYRLCANTHRAMLDDAQFRRFGAQLAADDLLPPGMVCAVGYVELSPRAALHNTTALLSGPDAAPQFRHRKVYLPHDGIFEEARYLRAGDRVRTIDLPLGGVTWRVGVLCGEDAWHNAAWLMLQARGVDLVLAPAASPARGVAAESPNSPQRWHSLLATQAALAGCYVAYVNRVGFEDEIHFPGGSALFAPDGDLVAHARQLDPDLVIAELDKAAITRARLQAPLRADEPWDVTLRELQRALAERD